MSKMDTRNKEWNIKVVFITFYKFSVTAFDGNFGKEDGTAEKRQN